MNTPEPLYPPRPQQPRLRPKAPRTVVRNIGLSTEDDRKLRELQELLSGGPSDSPSISLVVRKAINVYLGKLLAIKEIDPSALKTERVRLSNEAKRINARPEGSQGQSMVR